MGLARPVGIGPSFPINVKQVAIIDWLINTYLRVRALSFIISLQQPMKELDHLHNLHSVSVNENLDGLESMRKVFALDGSAVFLAISDLDLDTDGLEDPSIRYEPTHQAQTSIDEHGKWLNSNRLNFIVLPIGFNGRHGNTVPIGTLATVLYGDKVAHAVVADHGPPKKFGEGSIALHRAFGFERVRPNGHIRDIGIDGGVTTLVYLNSAHSHGPFTQADINALCAPLWAKFTS